MENKPIAVAKHSFDREDMLRCYDLLMKNSGKKKLRIILDIISIILCVFYTAVSLFYFIASPPHAHTTSDTAILLLMIFIIVLTVMRFVRRIIIRKRYADTLYKQIGNSGSEDCTQYFSDKIIITRAKSRYELYYSDTDKLYEDDRIFIIIPKTGASHIGRKDCFTQGSFEDVRRAFYSR